MGGQVFSLVANPTKKATAIRATGLVGQNTSACTLHFCFLTHANAVCISAHLLFLRFAQASEILLASARALPTQDDLKP